MTSDSQHRREYQRNYYRAHKEQCRKYYDDNKERIKEYAKAYAKKRYRSDNTTHKDKVLARNRSLKTKFLEMYGSKCECCGETTYEFLCLDHIKGRKRTFRGETGNVAYKRAIQEFNTEEYRILCANCNSATRLGRTCPHKIIK